MKSITIKKESCWEPSGDDFSENGFTISYIDEESEASIFDLSKDFCSKLILKEDIEKFWNRFMEINWQKVLLENEPYQGCDGSNSIVEISVGLQTLTLSLWCPDMDFYKEQDMGESLKLLETVYDLMKYAACQQVAVGFEF